MIDTLTFAALVALLAGLLGYAFAPDDWATLRRAVATVRRWRTERAAFRAGDGLHEWLVDLGRQVAAQRRWEQHYAPRRAKLETARQLRRAGYRVTTDGWAVRLP